LVTALCSGHGAISSSHHNFAYGAASRTIEPEFGLTMSNIPTSLVQKFVVSWRCMDPRRTCLGRKSMRASVVLKALHVSFVLSSHLRIATSSI
jgi:hypothetical protein